MPSKGHIPNCSQSACRLDMETKRREEIGGMAYYSEWVKAWKHDTSKEAVQKHFEETGEDESAQLMKMFQHQTFGEYRTMMGTDPRIQRDPLCIRMTMEEKKAGASYFKLKFYKKMNQTGCLSHVMYSYICKVVAQ